MAISDSTQSSCKCSRVPKIIITVSVKIMHSYNVCLSESTEMAQIMLQTRLHTEEYVAAQNRFNLCDNHAKWLFTLKESMMILSVAESFSKPTLKHKSHSLTHPHCAGCRRIEQKQSPSTSFCLWPSINLWLCKRDRAYSSVAAVKLFYLDVFAVKMSSKQRPSIHFRHFSYAWRNELTAA